MSYFSLSLRGNIRESFLAAANDETNGKKRCRQGYRSNKVLMRKGMSLGLISHREETMTCCLEAI